MYLLDALLSSMVVVTSVTEYFIDFNLLVMFLLCLGGVLIII